MRWLQTCFLNNHLQVYTYIYILYIGRNKFLRIAQYGGKAMMWLSEYNDDSAALAKWGNVKRLAAISRAGLRAGAFIGYRHALVAAYKKFFKVCLSVFSPSLSLSLSFCVCVCMVICVYISLSLNM